MKSRGQTPFYASYMRHHYVPQFLLRSWTDPNEDGKVEVFRLDLPHLSSTRHTPRYIGFENDLYALSKDSVAGMDKYAIEKQFLRNVDNYAAQIRSKLLENGLRSLNDKEKTGWVCFLMSLRLRQPNIIHMLKNKSAKHLRKTLSEQPEQYEELADEKDPLTLEEWTENQFPGLIENFGLTFFHTLIDNPKYGNRFLNMRWWLWDFSDAPYELLIADHPCIFTSGVDDPNLIVALPIAPNRAFMMTQSDRVAGIMRKQRSRELVAKINESSLMQACTRRYARDRSPERFLLNRMQRLRG